MVIGAHLNDGNGSNSGHVRVFDWNGIAWTQLGVDIDGDSIDDRLGFSISLNATGDRLAIGAPSNYGYLTDAGHVRVSEWDGVSWNLLGADLNGEAAGDGSGVSVSLNSIGDRLAIGAPNNDGNGIDAMF